MKKSAWTAICILSIACFAAAAIAAAVMGGCPGQIETATGSTVPMKCHWTFRACTWAALPGAVAALGSLLCRDPFGRRLLAVVQAVAAVVLLVIPTSAGIGLCADAAMHCHGTAHAVWALAAVAIVLAVIQIAGAAPRSDKAPMSL